LAIDARTARILSWSLIGAGGALILGGAIAAGVDGSATGNYRVVDEVLQQEVWATATGGWILISAGLAAAAAGVVLLLLSPRRGDEETSSRTFAPGFLSLGF
jgi:hypothetical protein